MKTEHQKNPHKEVILDALKHLQDLQLKVGWVAKKKYPNSTMTTAGVGVIAEEGSLKRSIPPRPIMRPTIKEQTPKWKKIIEIEVRKIFDGKQTNSGALNILGLRVAADFRRKIAEIVDPPLKESTVKGRVRERNKNRKRKLKYENATDTFRKPLVFNKIFINSLTHSIEKNDTGR